MRNGLCAVEHQLQRTTTALKHNIKVLQGDSSTLNLHEDSNQVAGLVSSIKQLQNELQMSITEILKLAAEWLGTSQQIQYDGEETETEDETELEDKVKVLADDTHLEVKQEGEVLRNPHNNATAETSKKRPRTSLNNHDIPEAKRTTSRISTADVDAIVARIQRLCPCLA
ncbi:hypothetical protein PI126_g3272 [Phytophthora idaei]|nr:hypothetical protein PI126_g3272 [Phytophthora idaei]